MQIADYLLPQPSFAPDPATTAGFDAALAATPPGEFVDYRLPYPRWQFLSYLCAAHDLVLHGSQRTDIDIVEPRQAMDVKAYSNQRAIYATTDGIWVIYFAILDRIRYNPVSLFNSCLQVRLPDGSLSTPLYFFSITHSVLVQQPWCEGAVYILPRAGFQQEPAQMVNGMEVIFPHWISTEAAAPRAKLLVGSQNFPFLGYIHGHDNQKLVEASTANPDGFPWPEALIT